jgi:hypothetical protein
MCHRQKTSSCDSIPAEQSLYRASKPERKAFRQILERKFHFLTIGNLCAVFSSVELRGGFMRITEGHGRLSRIAENEGP